MQPSKIYAIVGAVVILIVVLVIISSRSGSNLIEINVKNYTKCWEGSEDIGMPKSLMVGPCEKNDDGNCKLKAMPKDFEIKATFPPANKKIRYSAPVTLSWFDRNHRRGGLVAFGYAGQLGLICPDNEGKDQSLDWKPEIDWALRVGKGLLWLQVGEGMESSYCFKFPAEVVP